MENNIIFYIFLLIIENILLYLFFSWLSRKIDNKRKLEQQKFYEEVEKPFIDYITKKLT